MTWNLRVVKQIFDDEIDWFSIREVFYNKNGDITGYTEDPVDICGESIDELLGYLHWCLNCLDKPILEDGKVEFVDQDSVC